MKDKRDKNKGSVSIEAALSLTIFLTIILFVSSYLLAVWYEFNMQSEINEMSREYAKMKMYLSIANTVIESNDKLKESKDAMTGKAMEIYNKYVDDNLDEILREKAFGSYLTAKLALEHNVLEKNKILKIYNLDFTKSSLNSGVVDIVGSYNIRLPFYGGTIEVLSRAKTKDWTGLSVTDLEEMVYVTKTGTVYHKSLSCSHLNLKISQCEFGSAVSGNNINNKKYKKCLTCLYGKKINSGTVYITEYGDKYHISLECSGLTRSIEKIPLSQVKDKKPCSKCGGK